MSVAAVNQKEYLKKYLSLGSDDKKKKKRKKKVYSDRVQIVDDDIDLKNMQPLDGNDYNLYELAEDAPVIAGIVDERPDEVKALEVFSGSKWKIIQDVNGIEDIKVAEERTGKSHSDKNAHVRDIEIRPPVSRKSDSGRRQRRTSSDYSEDSDASPPRKTRSISDSDESPPRMSRAGQKSSGPQNYKSADGTSSRKADLSSPKRSRRHSDERGRSSDSDMSPPRKFSSKSNSKQPPRKRNDRDSDPSPRRISKKRDDSDESPPRKSSSKSVMRETAHKRSRFDKDSDPSPRRGSKYKQDSDESPPRKSGSRVNSDATHAKNSRRMEDSDESPPRKSQKKPISSNPPRRKSRFDRDPNELSPRKSRNADDSDESPPRKSKPTQKRSRFDEANEYDHKQRTKHENFGRSHERERNDSNRRPVKGKRGYPSDSDESPPRPGGSKRREESPVKTASRGTSEEGKNSKYDPRTSKKTDSKKMEKQERTLEGKKAGLQDSKAMRMENLEHQLREREMFSKMSDEVSGRDAAPIVRDRATGKKRDLAREAAEKEAQKEKEDKRKEKYSRWGKGLKQVEDQQSRLQDHIYEMSKPLARYADDKDLEKHLMEQEREGDPMQEYIRTQKLKFEKENPDAVVQKKTYPVYQGPAPPPNRFNIKPGYRWDGVDRSTGFEQKWFQEQNKRKALQEEAYKWSTEDM